MHAVERLDIMTVLRDQPQSPTLSQIPTWRADGRTPIVELYRAQRVLVDRFHWKFLEVFSETIELPDGRQVGLPATCLTTPRAGPALWIITGIHGEEPAGPDALLENLPRLAEMGQRGIPIVLFPLCNPLGYSRNWRYPNTARYSEANPGNSVGDSDHLLPDKSGRSPRAPAPSSRQCEAMTRTVLELVKKYPPRLVLDFHEDDGIERGYIYSQGRLGRDDVVAARIVAELGRRHFPLVHTGTTRFHEEIRNGVVADVQDGSIDELLSAPHIYRQGAVEDGPAAPTVLVIETGAKDIPLPQRVQGHGYVMQILDTLWTAATPSH